jgi:capsular exopolysaccharide synthesis family protein
MTLGHENNRSSCLNCKPAMSNSPEIDLQRIDAPDDAVSSEVVHSLLRLWQIAQHRRTTIMRAVCIAVIVGAVYYALAPRYYNATAKLWIAERNQDQVAAVADQSSLETTLSTHREIVTSPVVIQDAIENLLPEHRVDLENSPPSEWSKIIASRLSAKTTRKANFIEVSYRSLSPEAAAAVVSAVVQSYLQFVDRTHKSSAAEVISTLKQSCDDIASKLTDRKAELQKIRERVGSLSVKSEDGGLTEPTIQRALKLNDSLTDAQQHRMKLEASLFSIKTAIAHNEDLQQYLASLEEMVGRQMLISALGLTPQDISLMKSQEQKLLDSQGELQRLSNFYGANHPKVQELSQQIKATEDYLASYRNRTSDRLAAFGTKDLGPLLEKMLVQSVQQAGEQERQLQVAFNEECKKAQSQSVDMQRMQDVEHEIARFENAYDELIAKIATVDNLQLQAPIQATVVEEALPEDRPDSPKLRVTAIISLLAGMMIGCVVAYVQDVLDDRFNSPEEISGQLGVPVLSIVRKLDSLEGTGLSAVHTFLTPNAVETEAFRTLRTALTLGHGPTDRLAISSAEPSDGKTTVSANLAVSFAQAGKKTLIIDADLRKPGLTALMGLKGKPGVADILVGNENISATTSRAIQHTELHNLDVLPAGLRRPNPAELLSGPNFGELLAWAESTYDQVLVDCPPVLAVSDAQIVGRLVDGAILVVQPQKNHRRLVARACHSFVTTGTNMLGIVANGLGTQAAYGYGYGYGVGYGYGHDADQETQEETDRDILRTPVAVAA